jgi:hypothetical protein
MADCHPVHGTFVPAAVVGAHQKRSGLDPDHLHAHRVGEAVFAETSSRAGAQQGRQDQADD